MNKKILVIVILNIFLFSSINAVGISISDINNDNDILPLQLLNGQNELVIDGSDFKASQNDVEVYSGNCARLSGGFDQGVAYYLLSIGQMCEVNNNMEIGINYKDNFFFSSGPSIYICDFNNIDQYNPEQGWYLLNDNIGASDSFNWEWITVSDSSKYVLEDMGLIYLKVVADGNDDLIIRNIGVRYEFNKEPENNYDPYLGYVGFHPGFLFNDCSYTMEKNPNMFSQTITLAHEGEKIHLVSLIQILEDHSSTSQIEHWEFHVYFTPLNGVPMTKIGKLHIKEKLDDANDDSGVYLIISEYSMTKNNEDISSYLFSDGSIGMALGFFIEYKRMRSDGFANAVLNKQKYFTWIDFIVQNDKPLAPIIDGPSSLRPGREGTFKATTTDPDEDNIQYGWDWDNDGEVDKWTKSYESGEINSQAHSWDEKNSYTIKVKARDTYFSENKYESDWSEPFTVSVANSKHASKIFGFDFLKQFFNHSPIFQGLLQRILHI